MKIQCSKEDYLEAVLVLSKGDGGPVRSVDIAEHLGFSKASVSRAMAQLQQEGMIQTVESRMVALTDEGRETAARVYEKHSYFQDLLERAGVDEQTASYDACRLEHAIGDDAFQKLKQSLQTAEGPEE